MCLFFVSFSVADLRSGSLLCRDTSGVLDPCSCGEKAARCHDARLTPQHNPVLCRGLLCLDWAQEAHPAWCVSPARGHSTRRELLHPNLQALVSWFLQRSGKQNAAQRTNTPVVWFCTIGYFWFCLSLASKDGKKKKKKAVSEFSEYLEPRCVLSDSENPLVLHFTPFVLLMGIQKAGGMKVH